MRVKALPRPVDTNNLPSSQAFSQPTQEQNPWEFGGLPSSQATSTPINHSDRRAICFGNEAPSPILDFDDGYVEEEQDENLAFDFAVPQLMAKKTASNFNISDYGSFNQSRSDYNFKQPHVAGGAHRSRTVISGGIDRFNSLHSTNNKIIRKSMNGKKVKAGTVALREIRELQKTTHPQLRLAPFSRVVKEVMDKVSRGGFRIQRDAIYALREAAEAFLVQLFEASYLCTNHARRVTLMAQDMQLVRRILTMFGHGAF